jgi:hypothetical protein
VNPALRGIPEERDFATFGAGPIAQKQKQKAKILLPIITGYLFNPQSAIVNPQL